MMRQLGMRFGPNVWLHTELAYAPQQPVRRYTHTLVPEARALGQRAHNNGHNAQVKVD